MDPTRFPKRFQCVVCLGAKIYWFQGKIVRHDDSSIDCDHARACEFCGPTGLNILAMREHVAKYRDTVKPSEQCQTCLGFGNDSVFSDGAKTCSHCYGTGLNEDALERLLMIDDDQDLPKPNKPN